MQTYMGLSGKCTFCFVSFSGIYIFTWYFLISALGVINNNGWDWRGGGWNVCCGKTCYSSPPLKCAEHFCCPPSIAQTILIFMPGSMVLRQIFDVKYPKLFLLTPLWTFKNVVGPPNFSNMFQLAPPPPEHNCWQLSYDRQYGVFYG